MVVVVKDEKVQIQRLEFAPYGTNAYIIICQQTRDSVLIDAPADASTIVRALRGTNPRYILLTHSHMDHIGALSEIKAGLKVPLAAHEADSSRLPFPPEIRLNDGDIISFGKLELEVLHTPGHTPGSLCFRVGEYLVSAGDTIFPGGPGKTSSPANLQQIIKSITSKIFILPDNTEVYPGHGESTMLKKEKEQFAIFSARSHDPNLCGDVLWLSS